ncbi:MAG: hypothetical protein AAB225_06080 [Acidobacteriota bacterium]
METAGEKDAAAGAGDGARAYSEDGVDLTLIRWMLSLTPARRLQALQRTVRSLARLRAAQTKPQP